MGFVAEFRYNDYKVIKKLWDYAYYVNCNIRNAPLADNTINLSVTIKIEGKTSIIFFGLLDHDFKIIDKLVFTVHRLTLSECSKLIIHLLGCEPRFSQFEYKLSIGFRRIKEILNENGVPYSIRERYKPDRFISAALRGVSDTEPLILCHDSRYDDCIWISMYHDGEARIFLEPNKFKKNWRKTLVRGISEVIANSYSAGLSLPN